MSVVCVCIRDVISEFNSEIDGSLVECMLLFWDVVFVCVENDVVCVSLVGVSVFSIMCSQLLIMSEIS